MEIGYKIGGSFETTIADGRGVCIEVIFPQVYDSIEEAESNRERISLQIQCPEGIFSLVLMEGEEIKEIIEEQEWWKYQITILKKEKKEEIFVDAFQDYEPYKGKWAEILPNTYAYRKNSELGNVPQMAYWIVPVIKMTNDGSYTFRRQKSPLFFPK